MTAYRELGDKEGIATSIVNQAWILGLERSEFSEAIARADEA